MEGLEDFISLAFFQRAFSAMVAIKWDLLMSHRIQKRFLLHGLMVLWGLGLGIDSSLAAATPRSCWNTLRSKMSIQPRFILEKSTSPQEPALNPALFPIVEELVQLKLSGLGSTPGAHPSALPSGTTTRVGPPVSFSGRSAYLSQVLFSQKIEELHQQNSESQVQEILLLVQKRVREFLGQSGQGPQETSLGPDSQRISQGLPKVLSPRIINATHFSGLPELSRQYIAPRGDRIVTLKVFAPAFTQLNLIDRTGHPIASVVHREPHIEVTFSGDGQLIASADNRGGLKIMDGFSGAILHDTRLEIKGNLQKIYFAPDHRKLLVVFYSKWEERLVVKVLDAVQGQPLFALGDLSRFAFFRENHHKAPLKDLQFSADGRMVLTLDQGGTAKLWNLEDGKFLKNIFVHRTEFSGVHLIPEGNGVIGIHKNGNIELFSGVTELKIDFEAIGQFSVSQLRWSPLGRFILVQTTSGRVLVFEKEHQGYKRILTLDSVEGFHGIQFTSNEAVLMFQNHDSEIEFYDLKKMKKMKVLSTKEKLVFSLPEMEFLFLPQVDQLILSVNKKTLSFWDLYETIE